MCLSQVITYEYTCTYISHTSISTEPNIKLAFGNGHRQFWHIRQLVNVCFGARIYSTNRVRLSSVCAREMYSIVRHKVRWGLDSMKPQAPLSLCSTRLLPFSLSWFNGDVSDASAKDIALDVNPHNWFIHKCRLLIVVRTRNKREWKSTMKNRPGIYMASGLCRAIVLNGQPWRPWRLSLSPPPNHRRVLFVSALECAMNAILDADKSAPGHNQNGWSRKA